LLASAIALVSSAALATFHTFIIQELYSNASGTVQYIVLREGQGENGQNLFATHGITRTSGAQSSRFAFPNNLPSAATASRFVLIGTQSFAALGLIAPDYVVPDGFVPISNGLIDFAGVDEMSYVTLPTDGVNAVYRGGTTKPNLATNFAGSTASVSATTLDLNQHGLTGSWYEPATGGQGIELEVFPNLIAPGAADVVGAWFTFDYAAVGGADRQRWYTFDGKGQTGQPNVPITLYLNVGGNFNAPPVTTSTVVGSGTLAFTSCIAGSLTYTFTDGSGRTGTIPLTRLTPNITCAVGTTPTTNADFGFSGNWFDPTTSGQGFVFEVNPQAPIVYVTWYTYAPNGQSAGIAGQRWFTGEATFAAGNRSATFIVYETTGGLFDQPTTPPPQTVAVGTASVTFASCTSALFKYTSRVEAMPAKRGRFPCNASARSRRDADRDGALVADA
jgi:hypothetical protein